MKRYAVRIIYVQPWKQRIIIRWRNREARDYWEEKKEIVEQKLNIRSLQWTQHQALGLHHAHKPVTQHESPQEAHVTNTSSLEKGKSDAADGMWLRVVYLSKHNDDNFRATLVFLQRLAFQICDHVRSNNCAVSLCFQQLLLFGPVDNVPDSKDTRVIGKLEGWLDVKASIWCKNTISQ